MNPRFTLPALALAAASLLDAGSVSASPEVRDHRSEATPVSTGPTVRDHRDGAPVRTTRRYRRRPGPRFMMPLKVDIGAAGVGTARGFAPGIGAAVGIHWASLSPNPTDTDVGLGLFGSIASAPEDTSVMDDKNAVLQGGAYLEVGHTLSRGSFWRTWATGRGEYVGSSAFGNDHVGFGGTGRLSAELYLSGAGIEPRGLFLGTYAIGVYVEAGVRDTVADVGKFHGGMGLTFRTPLVFAP